MDVVAVFAIRRLAQKLTVDGALQAVLGGALVLKLATQELNPELVRALAIIQRLRAEAQIVPVQLLGLNRSIAIRKLAVPRQVQIGEIGIMCREPLARHLADQELSRSAEIA